MRGGASPAETTSPHPLLPAAAAPQTLATPPNAAAARIDGYGNDRLGYGGNEDEEDEEAADWDDLGLRKEDLFLPRERKAAPEKGHIGLSDVEEEESLERTEQDLRPTAIRRATRLSLMDEDRADRHGTRAQKQLKKVYDLVIRGRLDRALKILERVQKTEPENIDALFATSQILLQRGNIGDAQQVLEKIIRIAPKASHEVYFSLSELVEGEDALRALETGVLIANRTLSRYRDVEKNQPHAPWREETIDKARELEHTLARAHCSITEIYLAEMGHLPDSLPKALHHASQAISYDPNTFETHVALSTVHHTSGNRTAAQKTMLAAFDATDRQDANQPTAYGSLISGIRLGMDLGLFTESLKLLRKMQEDQESELADPQVWHLSAQCLFMLKDYSAALNDMYTTKQLLERKEFLDEMNADILQDVKEWIQETRNSHPELKGDCMNLDDESDENQGDGWRGDLEHRNARARIETLEAQG